jgi:hypothetical protein
MGWREVLGRWPARWVDEMLALPAPDRLALARELLPAGYVVARDVGAMPDNEELPRDAGEALANSARIGWNACRAAMMRGDNGDAA